MNVFAVVVAYHASVEQLARLCRTLSDSGAQIVVVDNSETAGVESGLLAERCTLISLGENTGIAHAQNVGITAAIANRAEVIVLFDQDSTPDETFLQRLLSGLTPGEPCVAAPICLDRATGEEMPSFRLSRLGWTKKVSSAGQDAPYEVDLVIASGSAATAATFSLAGKMDEDFFIDFVDFEWCLRCRARNIPIRVVPGAVMRHSIGQRSIDLGIIRGSVHGVSRSYYKVRNCFLLFRKRHVPVLFSIRATLAALVRFAVLLPFVKDRLGHVQTLILAIRHGVTGVVGKNPASERPACRT